MARPALYIFWEPKIIPSTFFKITKKKKSYVSSYAGKSEETWLGKLKLKKTTADLDDASTGTRAPFAQEKDNFNAPPEEAYALKRARGSARPLRWGRFHISPFKNTHKIY